MNPIIDKISWHTKYDENPEIFECKENLNNPSLNSYTYRSITKDEWDIVIHPFDNWIVKMNFDERCFPEKDYKIFENIRKNYGNFENKSSYQSINLDISRLEYFDKSTTLKEFIERIKERPAYGYFEGLENTLPETIHDIHYMRQKKCKNIYIINWGT